MRILEVRARELRQAQITALKTGKDLEKVFEGRQLKRLQIPGKTGQEARARLLHRLESTQQFLENQPNW